MNGGKTLNVLRALLTPFLSSWRSKDIPTSVSGASFKDIVTSAKFWRHHILFAVLLIICAILIVQIFPLTIPDHADSSVGTNLMVFLALSIQPLAIIAAFISLWLFTQFYSEQALALYIIKEGSEQLRQIKGKNITPPSLDDLENYIPFEAAIKNRILAQIFDDVYRDARDAVFGSPALILQPHKEHLSARLGLLTGIQTIALRLGILGTFIGLILGIVEVGGAFFTVTSQSNGAAEVDNLIDTLVSRQDHFESVSDQLFSALHVAFGTSVAGLEVSIIVNVFLLYLRAKQDRLFQKLDEATNVIFRLLRNALNESGLLSSFVQMQESMKGLERRMRNEFDSVSKVHEELAERVYEQVEVTKTGLNALREAKSEWNVFADAIRGAHEEILNDMAQQSHKARGEFGSFLSELNAAQRQFIEEAKGTLDLLSVGKLGKTIDASIRQAGTQIAGSLGEDIRTASDRLERYHLILQSMTSANGVLSERLNVLTLEISKTDTDLKALSEGRIQIQRIVERLEAAQQRFKEAVQDAYATAASNPIGKALANDLKKLGAESLRPVVKSLFDLDILLKSLERQIKSLDQATQEVTSSMPRPVMHYVAVVTGILIVLIVAIFGYFISTEYYNVTFW